MRPLKPAKQPTDGERKSERRFTRRMLILAMASGLIGSCANLALRTMGRPPTPRPPGSPPMVQPLDRGK